MVNTLFLFFVFLFFCFCFLFFCFCFFVFLFLFCFCFFVFVLFFCFCFVFFFFFLFFVLFFFSSVVDQSFWIKHSQQWNLSVINNEAIKEYVSCRSIVRSYIVRSFLSENSLRIIFFSMLKQQHSSGWRSHPVVFSLQYLADKQFFRMSFVCDGITFSKHRVKQDEGIFFPSNKKLESNYFIYKYW